LGTNPPAGRQLLAAVLRPRYLLLIGEEALRNLSLVRTSDDRDIDNMAIFIENIGIIVQ
jgi:hypothetical protein